VFGSIDRADRPARAEPPCLPRRHFHRAAGAGSPVPPPGQAPMRQGPALRRLAPKPWPLPPDGAWGGTRGGAGRAGRVAALVPGFSKPGGNSDSCASKAPVIPPRPTQPSKAWRQSGERNRRGFMRALPARQQARTSAPEPDWPEPRRALPREPRASFPAGGRPSTRPAPQAPPHRPPQGRPSPPARRPGAGRAARTPLIRQWRGQKWGGKGSNSA
jgi:hypothetical protein